MPNYGRALDAALHQFSIAAEIRNNREAAYAVSSYRGTVPAGQQITLHLYSHGGRFAGVIPDGRASLYPSNWRRYGTVTTTGTNVQLAKEQGYNCTDSGILGTLCSPPREHEHSIFQCSVAGRSPDHTDDNYCSPLGRRPGHAGTAQAWQETAGRLRSDIGTRIDSLIVGDRNLRWSQTDQRIHAANMHGYRQAVYLAKTVIATEDPALSAQIGAAGTAVLDVYDSLTRFRNLPHGASENLAAVALTGNLVSVGLTLGSALMDAGPSESEILIAEIRNFSKRVEELRREMHQRFDGVHEHLDAIYAGMLDGFRVLAAGNARLFESVMAGFANSHAQMTEIGRVQLDTQTMMVHEFERLSDELRDVDLALAGCLRSRAAGGNVNKTEFARCRDAFAVLHRRLPARQLPRPQANTTVNEWLGARPDRTISWDFATFKRLLRATGPDGEVRADGLPKSVVGPEAWLGIMALHDGFLTQYPEFASQDAGSTEFAQSMGVWRSNLIRYAEEIRAELRAYQDRTRPTAFSVLFDEAWNPERLAELLHRSVGDPIETLWHCLNAGHGSCKQLDSLRSSPDVRNVLLRNEEFNRFTQALLMRGAFLRHWIALAFRDAIGHSESITSLAAGWVTVPDVRQMVSELDVGFASWSDLIDEIDHRMELIEDLLRSDDLRAEVSGEFEHEILTGYGFPSLGDVAEDPRAGSFR